MVRPLDRFQGPSQIHGHSVKWPLVVARISELKMVAETAKRIQKVD